MPLNLKTHKLFFIQYCYNKYYPWSYITALDLWAGFYAYVHACVSVCVGRVGKFQALLVALGNLDLLHYLFAGCSVLIKALPIERDAVEEPQISQVTISKVKHGGIVGHFTALHKTEWDSILCLSMHTTRHHSESLGKTPNTTFTKFCEKINYMLIWLTTSAKCVKSIDF